MPKNLKRGRGAQFPVSVSTENIGEDQKKGHRVLRRPVSTVPLTGDQCRINHVAGVAFATGPALFKIMIQITEKIRLHFCKKVSARTGLQNFCGLLASPFSLMFLNYKLPQNKTYSISESGHKLISDRISRSLQENKKSTSSRACNCECLWHFWV